MIVVCGIAAAAVGVGAIIVGGAIVGLLASIFSVF